MKEIEIDRPLLQSLLVLAMVIEARDPYTGGHVWRTSRYATALAEAAGLQGDDLFLAQVGGLIHDLGKVGIPDAILNKRGRITEAEFCVVRRHPEIGWDIIANHPLGPLVELPVLQHHLRMDGRGYPGRLQDREPRFISRIVSIADSFDAMTSSRPYRDESMLQRATMEIESGRGNQFDAGLADAFLRLIRGGALAHILGHASEGRLMLHCPRCGPIIAPPARATDGDTIACPSCRGEFRLHFSGDAFELEWKGSEAGPRWARPDTDVVDEVMRGAPSSVKIDPE